LFTVKLAFGTEILKVSLTVTVQLPDVMVRLTIYEPLCENVTTGFGIVALLNDAIMGGTGVFPGLVPTNQLYELIVAGDTTVEAS